MNRVAAVSILGLAALLAAGFFAFRFLKDDEPEGGSRKLPTSSSDAEELQSLRQRQTELEARVKELETRLRREAPSAVSTLPFETNDRARAAVVEAASKTELHDARWFLDRYVESFSDGSLGLEHYRLAVDAHARELIDPMTGLILDSAQPVALRTSLLLIVGTPRFRGRADVWNPLLQLVRPNEVPGVPETALVALGMIGTEAFASELALTVVSLDVRELRAKGLEIAISLAGSTRNRLVATLLRRVPEEAIRRELVPHLVPESGDTALEAFELVPADTKPVRLVGAEHVGHFRSRVFRQFVEGWIARETDQDVLRLLGVSSQRQSEVPSYDAVRATGAPDTKDVRADSPTAWASQDPDGGHEWLELQYQTPIAAKMIRIFEVCSAGAVVEISATDANAKTRLLWKGKDPLRTPGVLELPISAEDFPISTLRITLDTARTPGWNEIDAVELVGATSRAFAHHATASTSYGHSSEFPSISRKSLRRVSR